MPNMPGKNIVGRTALTLDQQPPTSRSRMGENRMTIDNITASSADFSTRSRCCSPCCRRRGRGSEGA